MYEPTHALTVPEDEHIPIWRYMSVTQFLSLLDRRELWFARIDTLADPFEGYIPPFKIVDADPDPDGRTHATWGQPVDQAKVLREFLYHQRKHLLVNCWHMNQRESEAMWKTHLDSDEGIAVRSTFRRLADSFHVAAERISIGKVVYYEREHEIQFDGNVMSPSFSKRKSFEHEAELRACYWNLPAAVDGRVDFRVEVAARGIYITTDLDILIEEIVVSPTAPTWLSELVRSVAKRFNVDKPVVKSILAAKPIWDLQEPQ